MIWSKNESLSRDEIQAIQLERLQKTVRRVYDHVPFYRNKMDSIGLCPDDITSFECLSKLPFMEKDDFRQNYPFATLCVPMEQVVRVQATSGTSGLPTVTAYTKNDINTWMELDARIQAMGGVTKDDVVQISNHYGMFAGAFGHDFGTMRIGATVVPSSSGHSEKQLEYMKLFGVTAIHATPSYFLHLCMLLETKGLNPKDFPLKKCLVGGEGLTEAMREAILQRWNSGLLLTQNYGMCELGGTGVSGECEALNGMHFQEDHFLPEIIDPNTGLPCKPGEIGELVVTSLTREATPVIRYRTRDITRLMYEPCPCGRTTVRMDKVLGRTDQMMVIRGVNVYPSQIETVVFSFHELLPNYEILLYTDHYLDRLRLRVEVIDETLFNSSREKEKLIESIKNALHNNLSIVMDVELLPPHTFKEVSGKAKRIVDLRSSNGTRTES